MSVPQHQPNQPEAAEGEEMTDNTSLAEAIGEFRKAVESEKVNPDDLYIQRECKTCLHSCLARIDVSNFRLLCMYAPGNPQSVNVDFFCSQYESGGDLLKSQRKKFEKRISRSFDEYLHRDLKNDIMKEVIR
jgi:hypothetical protein